MPQTSNRGRPRMDSDRTKSKSLLLRLSPAVDDVAVVGIPDERLGEVPVAFLVGRPVADGELITLCREHLVAYKIPTGFAWVDALPRTEVGKIRRKDLIARASSHRLSRLDRCFHRCAAPSQKGTELA